MSGGYLVRFVGGPAHGCTYVVPELLGTVRIPIHKCHPLLVPSLGGSFTPGAAVYTLAQTRDGEDFYQYRYDEGTTK